MGQSPEMGSVQKKVKTRLSLKSSAWKGIIVFASNKFSKKMLGPENICVRKSIHKKIWFRKILVWKKFGPKKFGLEKI